MTLRWTKKSQDDRELEREAKRAAQMDELVRKTRESERLHIDEELRKAKVREENYKENRKRIYKMPYYDRLDVHDDTWIERVPGGWIFYQSLNDSYRSTFVPYAEESLEVFNVLQNGKHEEN